MRRSDRRSLAAFFFFALVLSGCGEKRVIMESPPVEAALPREEPFAEGQPAQPPQELLPAEDLMPRAVFLAEAPHVRIFILESRQPVRVRITSAFRIGVDTKAEPIAAMERGGDFTVRLSGGEAVLAEGKRRLISSGSVSVEPEAGGRVHLGGKPYRGLVCFRPFKGGLIAINILDIDEYIKGVLPS